ncbi:MAG: hypothetical protein OQK46_01240 [Gammaproteobacteria bacterium]|nr:hypothetical protein [Gammaproteobacteria bacterium]
MTKAIELTGPELDMLTEIFNLGVTNAASSLSTMLKQKTTFSVSHIEFTSVAEFANELGSENTICSVSEMLSGSFSAQSMLLFSEKNSLEIVRHLIGQSLPEETVEELQQEAFSEIGNIILNACIGSFAESLNSEFEIGFAIFELSNPLDLLNVSENTNYTALFMRINLLLSSDEITGYMAFLMGPKSLQQLKEVISQLLAKR